MSSTLRRARRGALLALPLALLTATARPAHAIRVNSNLDVEKIDANLIVPATL